MAHLDKLICIMRHPRHAQFARLCQLHGVKDIVGMDTVSLTVFAPVDRALAGLLAVADARQLNLPDLARNHMGK